MTNVMTPLAPNNILATTTTDYCGNVIYENGAVSKVLTEEGYITNIAGTPVYHYYLKDHQGNNRVVIDNNGTVEQVNHYYPFGGLFGDNTGGNVQPYKYNGKELDRFEGLDLFDYGARHYDPALARWGTPDPLAEKRYSISPYAYCSNNPINRIDIDGRDEFDFIKGEWVKISDIGGSIGVDFYHMGITNDKGKEITNVTDRNGNWIEMSGGREILAGGEIRTDGVDWKKITDEYINGTGPTKSIFEGGHITNEAIQEHYLYQDASAEFSSSGKDKEYIPVNWSPMDVAKTGTGNKQAQMMGSYGVSFYKLGDKTLNLITDSKSKTSIGLHLPFKNEDRKSGSVYNPWAGTWTSPNNSYKNTYQVYLFWKK